MTGTISDVIATASLLLAVVTAFMSFWYTDVSRAIAVKEPKKEAEKELALRRLGPVFWGKALPLAISATIIALIFVPRAVVTIREAFKLIGSDWQYDDLKAAFVLTVSLMVVLAVVTLVLAARLGAKCLRLRK